MRCRRAILLTQGDVTLDCVRIRNPGPSPSARGLPPQLPPKVTRPVNPFDAVPSAEHESLEGCAGATRKRARERSLTEADAPAHRTLCMMPPRQPPPRDPKDDL
jgi:hypothetical protein